MSVPESTSIAAELLASEMFWLQVKPEVASSVPEPMVSVPLPRSPEALACSVPA